MNLNWLKGEIKRLQNGVDEMNQIQNPTENELEIKRQLNDVLNTYIKAYEEQNIC